MALLVIATAQLMVVLDSTIVNVALPHIGRALGFSGAGLEWVVNAYALTFGGLLLLGGRAGDLLGRRRMFVTGLLLFSAASLAGGFATSQAWLLAARALQGAGGAIVAPAALALIVTTFPAGPSRSRGNGRVRRDERGGRRGRAARGRPARRVRLLAVGAVRQRARRHRHRARRPGGAAGAAGRPGRFDLPGAVTGTGGVAALVYGLSNATTSADGASHWGDGQVVAALSAAAVLLAAFAVIEARSQHALLPVRLLRNRTRLGAYLMMLGVGTAVFGVFFFITLFVQDVWGYSALRTGVAFLPLTVAVLAASAAAAPLVQRIGAWPLLLTGSAACAGGLYWLSRMTEHSTYLGGLLGPTLVTGAGLGLLFVPLPLVALARVADADSGVASSLLNAGPQVGGSIGLAVLGSVAWTVVADHARTAAGSRAASSPAAWRTAYQHALAAGFDRAFLVAAGVAMLLMVTAIATIRVRRADLAGG